MCDKLTRSGRWCCILKGQGLARLYPHPLWRQSGDIDVWVRGQRRQLVEMTRRLTGRREEVTYHHTDFPVFPTTPVELHFTPTWMFSPVTNRRLQAWFDTQREVLTTEGGFPCPTLEFDVLFVLIHIFRHIFDEGIGLRQVVDYFHVLRHWAHADDVSGRVEEMLSRLHLRRFAAGLMWVMHEVLGLPREWMIVPEDERVGGWLLGEIMAGGNFGRYDQRNEGIYHDSPRLQRLAWRVRRSSSRIVRFPDEALWEMPWRTWHYLWRMKNGYL